MASTMFTNKRLAAGLLAGTALMAPNAAWAAVGEHTAAGSNIALEAPFTTEFEASYNQNVRLTITRNHDTATQNDAMIAYACLYNSGTYVGSVRSDEDLLSGAGVEDVTQTIALPSSGVNYNQATFFFLFSGHLLLPVLR